MIFRFLFALLLTLGLGAKSWACSCAPWSGNVSDFTKSYISVWAVPIEAKVEIEDAGKASSGVTYRLDILEGYNRVAQAKIDVKSSLPDGGGSCGVELPRLGELNSLAPTNMILENMVHQAAHRSSHMRS